MNKVNAIKDKKDIQRMVEWLKEYDERYYVIFLIAINSGLRISDILNLKKSDLTDFKRIIIREKKTGKIKQFPLQDYVVKAIKSMKENGSEYLFIGKKGAVLDRSATYRVLKRCAKELGIKENIGNHSTRKAFGYAHYKQFNDIGLLQTIFNHSSPAITLRYIDVTQEEIDNSYNNLDLGLAI